MYKLVTQLISKNRQSRQSINANPPSTVVNNHRSLYIKPKDTKSSGTFKGLFKGFIYVEVALFAATYLLWKHMNNSQEFRFYLNQNLPTVLESKRTFTAFQQTRLT